VRVSERGHTNLSAVRTQKHEFYIGYEDPDGTIHLVPAVLVPATLVKVPTAGRATLSRERGTPPGEDDEEKP